MENERFQPYRRRAYRAWMAEPNGVPPRSTADRMRRREAEAQAAEKPDRQGPCDNWHNPVENINNCFIGGDFRLGEDQGLDASEDEREEAASQHRLPHDDQSNAGSLDNEVTSSEDDPTSEAESDHDNEKNDEGGPGFIPTLNNPLFPGGDCTKFECLLMIMNFSLRHGLSQAATADLCSMINIILRGDFLPASKYMLQNIFGCAGFRINFYCRQCESFIVAKENHEKMHGAYECEVCLLECNLANMNDNHFFVTFPVKQHLKSLLETTENVTELLEYRWARNQNPNIISDIFDGKVYSELCKQGGFLSHRSNISLTINTDGAQAYNSSTNTLWPMFFRINEFPPSVRFNFSHCLLGGIWFARHKPNMHLFLYSFVRDMDDLYENGFVWRNNEINITSKVIVLQCVADSKARPLVQNCKTHNGYYGCGFCLHPGVMYEGSSQAKYPMNDDLVLMVDNSYSYTVNRTDPVTKNEEVAVVEDRENDQIRQDMELAAVNRNAAGEEDIRGVRGKSILMNLPYFDLVFNFPVEYFHCCLLGVTRTVAGFWFDSAHHGSMFYAGLRIATVDQRLMSIKPPVTVSRRPRKISDRKIWHGNEWRNWLLYYSLPCMDGIIPSRYLRHHCLFVSAIYMLLQDGISHEDIDKATSYLGEYCKDFITLYGESHMYFNVHLLLHLGKCVFLHGPLFCFSAFSFEGANGKLVSLIKGTGGDLSQIAHKYNMCRRMPKVVEMYKINEATLNYCKDIMSYQSAKVAYRHNSIVMLGEPTLIPLAEDESEAMERSGHNITASSYERMVIGNVMFHARCFSRRGKRSDSSVVYLKSGKYGSIERIISPLHFRGPLEPEVLILLREINVLPRDPIVLHPCGARAAHLVKCAPFVYGDLHVITAGTIEKLAILIDCSERTFVTTFPNMYEHD